VQARASEMTISMTVAVFEDSFQDVDIEALDGCLSSGLASKDGGNNIVCWSMYSIWELRWMKVMCNGSFMQWRLRGRVKKKKKKK
jgi:hypothetical protein